MFENIYFFFQPIIQISKDFFKIFFLKIRKKRQFYENGKLKSLVSYRCKILDGLYEEYWRNGNKRISCQYKDGKIDKSLKTYFENGKLNTEEIYLYHDIYTWKGNLSFKDFFQNHMFYFDSSLKKKGKYNKIRKEYDNYGFLRKIEYLKDQKLHGTSIQYYKNGSIQKETEYLHNLKNGCEKIYYENGILQKKSFYLNNLRFGNVITYFNNGRISNESSFKNDKLNGSFITYNVNGDVLTKKNYINSCEVTIIDIHN